MLPSCSLVVYKVTMKAARTDLGANKMTTTCQSNDYRRIYVPGAERWVSLRQYIQAVQLAKANPDVEFSCGLTTWWPTTGREIVRQYLEGLDARINQATPYITRGK
jgi:hypothetical protein